MSSDLDPHTLPAVHERSTTRTAREDSGIAVSVVVPTLDEALLLPRLLARLADARDLSDRADEIVVADGGSRDRTIDVARSGGAIVVRADRGRGRQLREGTRHARGDVLLFLHADCLPESGALASVRRAFRDPSVEWAAMRQRVDARGLFYRTVERCADIRSRRGWVWGDSGLSVRRTVYESVGGFAPIALFEDVDLSRKLRARSGVRMLEDAVLTIAARRWRSEGALRATLRNWMLCAAYFAGADPDRLARRYRTHGSR